MNQTEETNNKESNKEEELLNLSDEYAFIRSEILTYTSIKFTLIAITASVTVIALRGFMENALWPWFSAIMIIIIACLGFLTAYAHAKITIAGAYITIFHSQRTIWDHLIYSKLKSKWTVATVGFFVPMLLFYLSLYALVIFYTGSIWEKALTFRTFKILFFPTCIYVLMIVVLWRSGRREPYEKIWKAFK
jgi:hypothetical protein